MTNAEGRLDLARLEPAAARCSASRNWRASASSAIPREGDRVDGFCAVGRDDLGVGRRIAGGQRAESRAEAMGGELRGGEARSPRTASREPSRGRWRASRSCTRSSPRTASREPSRGRAASFAELYSLITEDSEPRAEPRPWVASFAELYSLITEEDNSELRAEPRPWVASFAELYSLITEDSEPRAEPRPWVARLRGAAGCHHRVQRAESRAEAERRRWPKWCRGWCWRSCWCQGRCRSSCSVPRTVSAILLVRTVPAILLLPRMLSAMPALDLRTVSNAVR